MFLNGIPIDEISKQTKLTISCIEETIKKTNTKKVELEEEKVDNKGPKDLSELIEIKKDIKEIKNSLKEIIEMLKAYDFEA